MTERERALTIHATEIAAVEERAEAAATQGGRAPRQRARGRAFALPLALAAAWFALSESGAFSSQIFPSPQAVLRDLWRLTANGQLAGHIAITTWRVALGFAAGTLAASTRSVRNSSGLARA